ncbi:hypothetical protein HHI36_014390 [Cryptolaemus montrouzieri]|uniref:Uncharacterized protein n=1 Tax=Cryptolaemus montrouzieri TaxID=559131 RepID=A0ABD2N2E3_9CUCU
MHLYRLGIRDGYYKKYCRIPKQVVQVAKKMYNERYVSDSKNKQQAAWQLVTNYTCNVRKSVSILNEISEDQKSCDNVLHELNSYFVSVGDCRPDDDAANGDNGAKFEYKSLSNSLVL